MTGESPPQRQHAPTLDELLVPRVEEVFTQGSKSGGPRSSIAFLLYSAAVREEAESLQRAEEQFGAVLERPNLPAELRGEAKAYRDFVRGALHKNTEEPLEDESITVFHILNSMKDGGDDKALSDMLETLRYSVVSEITEGEQLGKDQALMHLASRAGWASHSFQRLRSSDLAPHWHAILDQVHEATEAVRVINDYPTADEIGEKLELDKDTAEYVSLSLKGLGYVVTQVVRRKGGDGTASLRYGYRISPRGESLLELLATSESARHKAGIVEEQMDQP